MPPASGGRVEGARAHSPASPVCGCPVQLQGHKQAPCSRVHVGAGFPVTQATPGPCERLTGVGPPQPLRMGCKTGEAGPWEVAVT